eukprot:scaffold281848_cov23-Prasinocladus_malaysianus.AAC.1
MRPHDSAASPGRTSCVLNSRGWYAALGSDLELGAQALLQAVPKCPEEAQAVAHEVVVGEEVHLGGGGIGQNSLPEFLEVPDGQRQKMLSPMRKVFY